MKRRQTATEEQSAPAPELKADEPESDESPAPDAEPTTDVPPSDGADAGPTLDPEPEVEATLRRNQCPRCKHVSSDKAIRFGNPVRNHIDGVFDGKPYQVIETQRIMCENCKQIHCVKKYI
jgi:hypothetical protein